MRTKITTDVMEKIRDCYYSLEQESLFEDGTLSISQARNKEKNIMKILKAWEGVLGRKYTLNEVFKCNIQEKIFSELHGS